MNIVLMIEQAQRGSVSNAVSVRSKIMEKKEKENDCGAIVCLCEYRMSRETTIVIV